MRNRLIQGFIFLSTCSVLIDQPAQGQDDTVRLAPKIELNYFQVNNALPYLTVLVRFRNENRWEPVRNVIVNLFLNEETRLGMMGNITTDPSGQGKYILPAKFNPSWDSLDQYTFIARIKGEDKVLDTKKIITIKRSSLQVSTEEKDSVRTIVIILKERKEGLWTEVSGVELKAFIDSNFGKLTVGEDTYTTNEAGAVEVEFSANMPGDEHGNIEVGAYIEDNDDYGTLTAVSAVAWGLPMQSDNNFFDRRTLWTSRNRAPWWLIIFPNLMIALVWGAIIYLLYMIILLKRIHRDSLKNQ